MLPYIIFLSFLNFVFSTNHSIIEGKVYFKTPYREFDNLIFNAVENGTFILLFETNVTIREVSGKLIGDIEIDRYNQYYETKVYVQNFTVGDYVRVSFHYIGYYSYMIIKRVDTTVRLFQHTRNFFVNFYHNNCEKPVYFFTTNDKNIHNDNQYYVYVQNHFGKVKASFKKECFGLDLDIENETTYDEIKNDSLSSLPICDVNLFKFQCEQPSLFSFYIAKKNFLPIFEVDHLNLIYDKLYISDHYHFYSIKLFYFQLFNLVGNTTADFTDFGDKIYSAQDFCVRYYLPEEAKYYTYTITNGSNDVSLALAFKNNGNSNKKIAEENVKTLYNNRILIKLKPEKKKKFIKIQSTIKRFYYCYLFSSTDDMNYLPSSCGEFPLEYGNFTYMYNPYYYNNKNNNYTWFIMIVRYYGEDHYYTYKYTDQFWEDGRDEEEKDEKETDKKDDTDEKEKDKKETDINEDEKNSENETSSFVKVFLGIVISLGIVIILGLAFFAYRKRKINKSEMLLNTIENKNLVNNY